MYNTLKVYNASLFVVSIVVIVGDVIKYHDQKQLLE